MKLTVLSPHVQLSPRTIAYIERRLGFALDRFRRIREVKVCFFDVNGLKGGRGISCKVHVEIDRMEPILSQDSDSTPFGALTKATRKLRHAVARHLERRKRPFARTNYAFPTRLH